MKVMVGMPRKHYDERARKARSRQRHLGRHDRWLWLSLNLFGRDFMSEMKRAWRQVHVKSIDYSKSKLLSYIKKDK